MARHGIPVHFATIRRPDYAEHTEAFLRESGFSSPPSTAHLELDKVALCEGSAFA